MIKLIEETHKYIDDADGREYTSVSAVLSQFKKPFDSKFWAEKKAKDYGTSPEEVTAMWDDIKDTSCVRGKNYHKIMEDFLLTGKREEGNDSLYDSFVENIDPLGMAYDIHAEKLLHCPKYFIAGTADVILDHGQSFSIMDFKTNKAFRFFSKYKEHLLAPVDHLQACEFNTYGLQLSLYALMYSNATGKKVKSLNINFLDKETQRWTNIPIHYMKYEALLLMRSFKA